MNRSTTIISTLIALTLMVSAAPVAAVEDANFVANESLVEQLFTDFIDNGDANAAVSLLSDTFIAHDPLNGDMDRDIFIAFYTQVMTAMPEYALRSGGNMVALQILGIDEPPTMLNTELFEFGEDGMLDTLWNFFWIEDGQIIEAWLIYDELSLWQFVGEPGSPSSDDSKRSGFSQFQ